MSQSYCICEKCGEMFDVADIGLSDECLTCLFKTKKVVVIDNTALTKKLIDELAEKALKEGNKSE